MKQSIKWKFSDAEDTTVFTTRQVISGDIPILYVSHDQDDGTWEFHHRENVNADDTTLATLTEVVDLDSTLNELFDLPLGWIAIRHYKAEPWRRKKR